MPSAPPALNSGITDEEQPVSPATRAPASAAQRVRLHKAKALPARWASRRAQKAAASASRSSETSGAAATAMGNQLRRAVGAMRHVFTINYYDPFFERPDLIEDDYYRLRNQPYGY